ncbi:MAG: hypothetical protein A2Y53_03820 [Chloroflexi bacterium RBG_16_47_49]|nr:MAG: hypothetical protein A2Y53_03820 [Chloroflexi bacterium RBG_16_47_49]
MKIKEVTLSKEFKIGLPNYSNQTVGMYVTWEIGEEEEFDFPHGWDTINQQLSIQADNLDPSWITRRETKDKYKATVHIPKQNGKEIYETQK